ncbi:cupin domain-containing protein [candidate division FCPU426 bacterium]|nr:cupin domain-containing protein [candidate division FCPU426 bacterium]
MTENELIRIHYQVTCPPPGSIERLAKEIALEQTVEVSEECIPTAFIREEVVGQVLLIQPLPAAGSFEVHIGYSPDITAYQIPQFLNLFFGNISLKNNIRITEVKLPETFVGRFAGPNHGMEGVRRLLGVHGRPLAATALKPMGSSPAQLAALAEAFALGGGDIVKDDHGLADQPFCPFQERVARCQEAVLQANLRTGRRTLYFPNVVGGPEEMAEQIDFAVRQDVRGVLLSPFLVGPDVLRHLAEKYPLVFMTHPSFTGTYFHDRSHGIAPGVFLGTIFRLLGADISVFPNSGGRFAFTPRECQEIAGALRQPLGGLRAALPGPAGGMRLDSIPAMARQYGTEAVYIIGQALLLQTQNMQAATRAFMAKIREHFSETLSPPLPLEVDSTCDWMAEKETTPIRAHLAWQPDFSWEGRRAKGYKAETELAFQGMERVELAGKNGEKTDFDLRYFQLAPEGFSSLEKHQHAHVIITLRGQGILRLEGREIPLRPFDIAYVGSYQVHQLRNAAAEPFGFFCVVDHVRDKPQKP